MGAHREGVWTGHDARPCPADPNGRRLVWEAGALVGGGALPFLVAPLAVAFPVAAAVVAFGTLGLMGRHADERRRRMEAPVQALREEFGVGPVWKVDLMVRQGEAPTGRDRGLIWVEGGRVVFAGFRTSFALVPAQAADGVRHVAPLRGQRLRLNLPLARSTPAGPLSLSFWPIADGRRRAEADASDLRSAINRALGDDRARPGFEGQWPPVGIGPDAPSPRALWLRALGPHAGWTLVAAAFGLGGLGFAPWAGAVAFIVVAVGTNLAVASENAPRWRAWRDARTAWREG